MNASNIIGERFGRLIVYSRLANVSGHAMWAARCSCGNATIAAGSDLKRGFVKSCGCLRKETSRETGLSFKHGHARQASGRTPTYRSWRAMHQRCNGRAEGHPDNLNYVARGITICERWQSFEHFLADMGARPEGKTLDRKNNDQGYNPNNCKWSTPKEQAANRRSQKAF